MEAMPKKEREWLPQDFSKSAKGARAIQDWLEKLPHKWAQHGHKIVDKHRRLKVVMNGSPSMVGWAEISACAAGYFDQQFKAGNYGHQVAWFFADLQPRSSSFVSFRVQAFCQLCIAFVF